MTHRQSHPRPMRLALIVLALIASLVSLQTVAPSYSAHARIITEDVLQDAYFVNDRGERIEKLEDGDPAPRELRFAIRIPEGVKDGDYVHFSLDHDYVVHEEGHFKPLEVFFEPQSTTQILSTGANPVAIADVIADDYTRVKVVFNSNADAERGNQLFTSAYQVGVLLGPADPVQSKPLPSDYTNPRYIEKTKDRSRDDEIASFKSTMIYSLRQYGESMTVLPQEPKTIIAIDGERVVRYYHAERKTVDLSYNLVDLDGTAVPQPTEMLVQWSPKIFSRHSLSTKERDLVQILSVPEGVELETGSDGSVLSNIYVRALTYQSEADALADPKNALKDRVSWGDFEGPENTALSHELTARAQSSLSPDGRTLTITVPKAPPGYGYILLSFVNGYTEYSGAEQTTNWEFRVPATSMGEGTSGNQLLPERDFWEDDLTLTSQIAAAGGLSNPEDVKRSADVEVSVNGSTPGTGTALVAPGKVSYSVKLVNKSNVTLRLNSITLPDGTVQNMEALRIRTGSSESFDFEIDEAAFAGTQDRTFKAKFALMDPVEGTVSLRSENPRYSDETTKVLQTVSTDIAAPSGMQEGITFAAAENTPRWVEVNPDGSLTVTPPKDWPAGPFKVPVKITYSGGTSDIIEAPIVVIELPTPSYPADELDALQTVPTTIPAPTVGADGITFAPTDNTPDWVKVNPDGALTVTPPKRTDSGENPIELKITYKDGSTETITIPLNVIELPTPSYPADELDALQTVPTTIPAPTVGADGITFAPTDNTPDWVKVNPDGALTVTPPKRTDSGENPIELKITYNDGSTETITIPLNVIEVPSAEVNGRAIAISGEQPDSPADVVSNFADLPEGTTIEWKDEVPTDKLGQSEHVAVVTYPDGSKEEIRVPVAVVINQEQYERLQNERDKARESVNALDKRLNNGLGRCIGTVGGSLLALIPAVIIAGQLLGGLHIPELDRFFADTQRQLGVYNPDLAKIVYDNRGAIGGALAAVSIIPLFLIPDMCRDASIAGAVGEQLSS